MMIRAFVMALAAGVSLGFGLPTSWGVEPSSRLSAAERQRADAMIVRAIAYLRTKQNPASGGWSVPAQGPAYPAITGLVVRGMMMQPGVTQDDANVAFGVKFMLNYQQADGGIYDKVLQAYNTSICVSALSEVNTPQAKDAVKKGVEFLKSLQFGEGAVTWEGLGDSPKVVGRDHPFYGGWGYGRHGRPDLSNSAWAIEALHAAGVEPTDEAFKRALVFLQRTQMVEKVEEMKINDMEYAKGSKQGGFVYATSVNKDKIGVGQSQAGEIAESLSGPRGTVAHVVLKKDVGGRPIVMMKGEIEKRINVTPGLASPSEAGAVQFMVVLGPSSDGESASEFEVRTSLTSVADLRQMLGSAFREEVDGEHSIRVREAASWMGESRLRAYGSMTYSGFKSYLYANLAKDDPRVTEALRWIGENYTVQENPGMGTDGLYYYYVVMAKALDAWGSPTLATPNGDKRWADDLVNRLGELQSEDGSFKPVDDRWLENDPVLITAYSLLALQHAARGANPTR
jgi:hypothetical protein